MNHESERPGIDLLSDPQRHILTLLRGAERTIPELASGLGVTPNAVRGHLAALEREGMIERGTTRREAVGQPARLYRLTSRGEELFPRAYAPVLLGLLDLLTEWDGPDGVDEILEEVGARLAGDRARGGAESAALALRALGVEVRSTRTDWAVRLEASGCPLAAAVAERPVLCGLMAGFVSAAAGGVAVACCDRNGGRPRCRFDLSDARR
jgi:predicted ArsR family transcriptional regulator